MTLVTKRYDAKIENLTPANEFVGACADRFGLGSRKKFELLLSFEEAFVNVCSYAYPGSSGYVELSCKDNGDSLVLEIEDSGLPFDVLSLPDPDTTSDIENRQIGGLGIHFIRKLSDSVSYRRENDKNILQMTFRRSG